MRSLVARRHSLDAVLEGHGVTNGHVLDAVTRIVPDPAFVLATGSCVEGWNNPDSDIDVEVICFREMGPFDVSEPARRDRGPRLHLHFDSDTRRAGEIEFVAGSTLSEGPPDNRRVWLQWRDALSGCIRLHLGVPIAGADAWHRTVAGLDHDLLANRLESWWALESFRRTVAAEWLRPARPLAAGQRLCDAVLAALEARAARTGQLSWGTRWLPERLRRMGDTEGLMLMRQALRLSCDMLDDASWTGQRDILTELSRDAIQFPHAQLRLEWLPGVEVHRVGNCSVASRWALRAIELPDVPLADPKGTGAVVCLSLDEQPANWLTDLFQHDFVWLGIDPGRACRA
jgi:hypothetical protein